MATTPSSSSKRVADRAGAVAAVRDLLVAVGEDVGRAGLERTPERVADRLLALFEGIDDDPLEALGQPVALEEGERTGSSVGLTRIAFQSTCEHHLLPFSGHVDIHYIPDRHIAGLSRLARLVEVLSHRPQLQERLGQQIADTMMARLHPRGVLVRIEAHHGCVAATEPGASGAVAVTVAAQGEVIPIGWLHAVLP